MDFSKYLGEVGLTELWNLMTAYVDGKIFIGTREEYELKKDSIQIGAIVILLDDEEVNIPPVEEQPEISSTTAVLGFAKLGQMRLGNP